MTGAAQGDYRANLRAEEAAILKSEAFWRQKSAIEAMGEMWVQTQLQALHLQLHNIRKGLATMEQPHA